MFFDLVHGVHEGDPGLDGKCSVFPVLRGAAHGQGEGQSPQEVGGGQRVASFAFGFTGERIGDPVGVGAVHAHGDDAGSRRASRFFTDFTDST